MHGQRNINISFHVLRLSIYLCFVYYTPTNEDNVDAFSATLVWLATPPRTLHIDFETGDRQPSCSTVRIKLSLQSLQSID